MPSFLYGILSGPDDTALELTRCAADAITEPMWAELAEQIAYERGILPYPAAILARRAAEGYAAVAVSRGHIVSHVALVPIGCRAGSPGASHTWAGFLAAAGLNVALLPSLDLYDCAGAWTAPAWRGKGISMALHTPLLQYWLAAGSLGVSGTAGTTSPRLGQLGWQILGWSAAPFVSSMIGIPLAGFEDYAAVTWQPLARPGYDGPPIDPCDRSHAWSRYCYWWVSNPALARRLDGELAELCRGDLHRWRQALLGVFSQPGALHRLALLP